MFTSVIKCPSQHGRRRRELKVQVTTIFGLGVSEIFRWPPPITDRQLFSAVREDDEELFASIAGDGEEATLDINYLDGCAISMFRLHLVLTLCSSVQAIQVPTIVPGALNGMSSLYIAALHIAASVPSPTVLEHILAYPECDVDPLNRLERATPLHLAVRIADPEIRLHVVESLLEAGADTKYVATNTSYCRELKYISV